MVIAVPHDCDLSFDPVIEASANSKDRGQQEREAGRPVSRVDPELANKKTARQQHKMRHPKVRATPTPPYRTHRPMSTRAAEHLR